MKIQDIIPRKSVQNYPKRTQKWRFRILFREKAFKTILNGHKSVTIHTSPQKIDIEKNKKVLFIEKSVKLAKE